MKILFITPAHPFDCSSGGGVRTSLIYSALSECGTVYTTVFDGWDLYGNYDQKHERIKIVPSFQVLPRNTIKRWMFEMLCVITKRFDRWLFPTKNELLKRLGWEGETFDVVVSRFTWTAVRTAAWIIAPLVIDIDDLPTEDFKTMSMRESSWLKGQMLYQECRVFSQNAILKRAAASWLPNKKQISLIYPIVDCDYLPNIVQRVNENFDQGVSVKKQLLTVGSLNYNANTEGIDWFLENVWSAFHGKYPEYEYVVVGKGLADTLRQKWMKVPAVRLAGFVKDLNQVYAESEAVVSPVFIGGGTAVKTIEALAYGKKIFATRFAVRGLSEQQLNRSSVSLFETCTEFIQKFDAFKKECDAIRLQNKQERMRVVAEDYSEKTFCEQVETTMKRVSRGMYG